MNLLITICARGGSKGIPQKNIRLINGVPLIEYSIRHALAFAKDAGADVELSTDDQEIALVAAKAGMHTEYKRPSELSGDTASKLDTIKDVLLFAEKTKSKTYDMVLDLDVTSPLRTLEDLRKALKAMEDNPKARNLFSVSPPAHNPYFDMVEENSNGFFDLVKKPEAQMSTRQQGPRVYELNASFYYYRRSFFNDDPMVLVKESLTYVMPHMCFELDEMIDYELLEFLLREQKLDFTFE